MMEMHFLGIAFLFYSGLVWSGLVCRDAVGSDGRRCREKVLGLELDLWVFSHFLSV